MATKDDLTRALDAHMSWRGKLQRAAETKSADLTVARAGSDNACEFGTWLYAQKQLEGTPDWTKVRELHKEFHKRAAVVLEHALAGRAAEVATELSLMGKFSQAGGALSLALRAWSSKLS